MDKRAICDRNELGRPMVAPTSEDDVVVSATNQTKIYISLFTIKSKETRGSIAVHGFLRRY